MLRRYVENRNARKEAENDRTALAAIQIAEDFGDRRFLGRALTVFVFFDLLVWALDLLAPSTTYDFVSWVNDEFSKSAMMAVLGLPLCFGLFTAYGLLRLKFPDLEGDKTLDDGLMASYNYERSARRRYFVWLGSIAAGVVNLLLLILANLHLTGRL